ncbi:MAG TPA: hypothetical protein VI854_00385, partial [Acidimicrobiia bacterium]|nr:hypothetical protein [Acidimicrobiia bacterium]
QQVGNVIAKFRDAEVNTVLSPDGGFPMSFTQQAEAQGYRPDYLVWPCSGQDTGAQVRLFNPAQWERASGLGCFDEQFRMDLVLDDSSRESEWYDQYRQMSDRSEPPVNTPLVYAGLLQLVVGINNAGPHLGDTTFAAGLDAFTPYRYNAELGAPATDANVQLGAPRSSFYRDVAVIEWSNAARWPGNPLAGAYRASDGGARHRPGDPW